MSSDDASKHTMCEKLLTEQFSSCTVALNTLYSYGGTVAGTSPGSSLMSGAGNGSLASPTVLK